MIKQSIDQVRKLAVGNKIVPISLEIFSDIKTPIQVLKNFMEKSNRYYLLESVEGGEKWGRYSFLGFDPKMQVKCTNGNLEIIEDNSFKSIKTENPSEIIREILLNYKSPKVDYLPPFTGGFVGYFSYDYIKYAEKSIKFKSKDDIGFCDLDLMLFDKVIAFDHLKQKIIIIVNVDAENIDKSYVDGVIEIQKIANIIKMNMEASYEKSKLLSEFIPVFEESEYSKKVEKIKNHIYEGDIFQAVFSNRLEAGFEGNLLSTYRVLRTMNPSPYMFYLNTGDVEITGASPETLITLKDGELSTFPIAGTRKRGESEAEDEEIIKDLLNDKKELSEHNMLVDLSRNDLGKISEFNSVKVEDYLEIIRFSHVIHIASTVKGKIRKDFDALDAVNAVLPAGTLSGAPKIRACEIIDELEGNKRGIYGGAIGYIDFTGNMDLCISIRMTVKKDNKVYVQSGAGIVAGSNPQSEYNECINKAKVMVEALKLSKEVSE